MKLTREIDAREAEGMPDLPATALGAPDHDHHPTHRLNGVLLPRRLLAKEGPPAAAETGPPSEQDNGSAKTRSVVVCEPQPLMLQALVYLDELGHKVVGSTAELNAAVETVVAQRPLFDGPYEFERRTLLTGREPS